MENNGIEIEGEVNMRLTVGEWLSSWLCREEGVQFASKNDRYKIIKIGVTISREFTKILFLNFRLNFKLVLAEPLDNSKGSHVQTFLDQHGGPGLQHIGLTTANASITVQVMSDQGAKFRKPPPTYYQLVSTNNFYFQLCVIFEKKNSFFQMFLHCRQQKFVKLKMQTKIWKNVPSSDYFLIMRPIAMMSLLEQSKGIII